MIGLSCFMKWECDICGRCCKGLSVEITESDARRLESLGYDRSDFLTKKNNKLFLKKKFRWCVFLEEDMKCKIQRVHGYDSKPEICKAFPIADGANQMVCGVFSGEGELGKVGKQKNGRYRAGKNVMSTEELMVAIRKLTPDNYGEVWNGLMRKVSVMEGPLKGHDHMEKVISDSVPMKPSRLVMNSVLSQHTRHPIYGLIKLYKGDRVTLKLPTGQFVLEGHAADRVKVRREDVSNMLKLLKAGHGIPAGKDFPTHLSFIFYFLERFSKSIAYKNRRKETIASDVANAYTKLNSIIRFVD
ncbi:MAG: hypothetical protein DRO99_00520 [Candidatus Aenigmatarchaeota archaeon]|nr:MAG: hypothetical protein DRO99_00520 [Candidatus Aenigmarchaeota archaeon]